MHAALAGFFFAGYLGRYVHPTQGTIFQFAAVLLPYASLLILVALFVTLLKRNWQAAGVYGILAILAAVRFVDIPPRGVDSPPDEPRLGIVSSNFMFGLNGAGVRGRRRSVLSPPADAKIVALQETILTFEGGRLLHPDVLTTVFDSLGFNSLRPAGLPNGRYRQPVLSTLEMKAVEQLRLRSGLFERDDFFTRAELEWRGEEIVVYNLHLRSFDRDGLGRRFRRNPFFWPRLLALYATDFTVRADQAAEIRRMIDAETSPVILVGDFNSTPHNWSYAHLRGDFSDAITPFRVGWSGTFPNAVPLVHIDHVLVSDRFEVVASRVERVSYSDHRAVSASLRLKPADHRSD